MAESTKFIVYFALLFQGIIVSHATQCPVGCDCRDSTVINCIAANLQEIPTITNDEATTLIIEDNTIAHLKGNPLSGMPNLDTLQLRGNGIQTIDENFFRGLFKLKNINLRSNHIVYLNPSTFADLQSLGNLDLSWNSLMSVDGLFSGLVNLQVLDISNNDLTSIQPETFSGLANMTRLLLSANDIQTVHTKAFADMRELKYLTLNENPLQQFDGVQFSSTGMFYVNLANTHLSHVPRVSSWMVQYVQLRNNYITSIRAQDFRGYRALSFLMLESNEIRSMESGALEDLPYLQHVSLGQNQLRHIPLRLPRSIRHLDLHQNNITTVGRGSFLKDSEMRTLDLRGNKVRSVDNGALNGLQKLTQLFLHQNRIQVLRKNALSMQGNLQDLNLANNRLTNIEQGAFRNLSQLTMLDLSNISTRVEVDPGSLRELRSLETLSLSRSPSLATSLLKSPDAFKNLKNLTYLSLAGNRLQTIRNDIPDLLPSLERVDLSQNFWHCDSSLLWLAKWMHVPSITFIDAHSLLCQSPKRFTNRMIASLTDLDFTSTTTLTTTTSTKTHPTLSSIAKVPEVRNEAPYYRYSEHPATETTQATADSQTKVSNAQTVLNLDSNKLFIIIACTVGGILFLICIVLIILCVIIKMNRNARKSKSGSKSVRRRASNNYMNSTTPSTAYQRNTLLSSTYKPDDPVIRQTTSLGDLDDDYSCHSHSEQARQSQGYQSDFAEETIQMYTWEDI